MTKWDAKYRKAGGGVLFGRKPNAYLADMLRRPLDRRPRTALCLADGDGRNGRFLAAQGLLVTAVDISAVASELAGQDDHSAGVSVNRVTADLSDWRPPDGATFDIACLIYLQCDGDVRRRALRIAWNSLAPGGLFVFEGFAGPAAETGQGQFGPRDRDLLYDLSEIEGVLPEHSVRELLYGQVRLCEGSQHRGFGTIIRAAAERT